MKWARDAVGDVPTALEVRIPPRTSKKENRFPSWQAGGGWYVPYAIGRLFSGELGDFRMF